MNSLQTYLSPSKRVNISLPIKLLAMIDKTYPDKKRSQVIAEATAQQISETKKKQAEQGLKKGFQYSAEIVKSDYKKWEKIMVHDATDEKYNT
jgi:metal-responsive CopG/Arc/MetJ family transcriptional regulator